MPGELCESDFTHLTELGITIGGEAFPHMLYHFVLTYSNWETGTICYSESFASLSEGLQKALWELGGVPLLHRTDRMTAAVNNLTEAGRFSEKLSGAAAALRRWKAARSRPVSRTKTETSSSGTIASNVHWIRH